MTNELQSAKLLCSGVVVAVLKDAFESDGTWYAKFNLTLDSSEGDKAKRILEYIALSKDWNDRCARDPKNPPDEGEFNEFSDLIKPQCWSVEFKEGKSRFIAEAPIFLAQGEVSWYF